MSVLQRPSYHTTILSLNPNSQPQQKYKTLLKKLSKTPTYQYLIILFVILTYTLVVFNTMIGSFVFMNPIIECNGLPSTEDEACQDFSQCVVSNNFTAAYRNDLYCEKQLIRSTIQSVFGIGYIIGKVCFPVVSDVIGRRSSVLVAVSLGIFAISALLLGIEYDVETLMVMGQLITGIFGSGISTLHFIYVCDFCTDRIREFCLTNLWAIWGIAQMFFYILYFYIPGWKFYLTATMLIPTAVLFILVLFFMVESPVYVIFVKKDVERFQGIVEEVGRYTGLTGAEKVQIKEEGRNLINLLKKTSKQQLHLKQTLTKIFCSKKNLLTLTCLILTNIGYVFFYYGMQGSMQSVGFNFGLNMLFTGVVQFFGFITAGFVTRRIRRKPGILVSTVVSSVLGLLFLLEGIKESQVLQTVLVVLARLVAGYVFCFFVLLESQILDVEIRSVSFSLIDGTGQVGRIIAPYIINIMYNIKVHPIIAFSIVFISLGALPVLLLKQKIKKDLSFKDKQRSQGNPKSVSENSALFLDEKDKEGK